ncbi:hypothetical protein G6N73_24525 [Mesorhizobium camelthorni]|uniref:Mutator family transposase n=1 Tax=Allomesorhizobium camelthorni TaxID=475069 RepID=A0A6G4WI30_9HYPH|nr:hypothetical protein [Mesorhizobium camelthorni]
MTRTTVNAEAVHPEDEAASYLFDNWFDPIEAGLRERVRGFIETMLETELDAVLARPRYGRQPAARSDETTGVTGHRHGRRTRTLTGTFGITEITVSRARLDAGEDKTVEWKSKALRAYQRRTMAVDALIALFISPARTPGACGVHSLGYSAARSNWPSRRLNFCRNRERVLKTHIA